MLPNANYLHMAICKLATWTTKDDVIENFFRDLEQRTQHCTVAPVQELNAHFTDVAENHICKGAPQAVTNPDHLLINVCSVKGAFKYLTRENFSDDEEDQRFLESLDAYRVAISQPDSTRAFLELKFKRLRSPGRAFWLTPGEDVGNCKTYADYNKVLGLEEGIRYAFVFEIGCRHVGRTPVEKGNGQILMTLHAPSHVDGMYYEKFILGGHTIGGAREYVSRLNNCEAIDALRIVE